MLIFNLSAIFPSIFNEGKLFPASILAGNFLINISIIIIGSLFLLKLIKNEINFSEYKVYFYLLVFFFSSLIINLIFSNDIYLSYQRVVKFFFVIFFILAFRFLILNYHQKLKYIYRAWSIIFLIVIIDLIFEFLWEKIYLVKIYNARKAWEFYREESVVAILF